MDKYLKAFTNVVFFLCCLLFTTNTVGAATTKNKQFSFQSPIYQASLAIHNHDTTFDVMTAIRTQSKSLWYSNTKIQYLYSGYGSLLSLGGGYRWALSPLWVIGGHADIEGGCLPQSLGYYAKLNPGLEAHAKQGGVSLNVYLPVAFGSFNAPIEEGKLEQYDYTGHQARHWDYVEQNQLSLEVQGYFDVLPYLAWSAGFYNVHQVKNPSIIGVMTRIEYRWNHYVAAKFQYNFDNFHHHYITFGCQFWIKDQRWGAAGLDQKLWKRPLSGHIAPIQIVRHRNYGIGEHHLFFDSEAEGLQMTEATYENQCPKLNHEILQQLRSRHPLSVRKVVMHLSGFFDLADGFSKSEKISPSLKPKGSCKASLELAPHEHIQGEISKFDILKHLEIDLKTDDLQRNPMVSETLTTLKLLACYGRVIDGRPILRGAVFLNSDTSLSQVAILPARDIVPCDISISSTDASKEGSYRQSAGIIVQRGVSSFPTQRIAIQDVIISGWPRSSKPYQYVNGIDMRYCDGPKLGSVWIDHAQTGILFAGVRQTQENLLNNIYIGNFHVSSSPDRVRTLNHMLSNIAKAPDAENHKEALYYENKKMLCGLRSREVNPRALFKHVKTIDTNALPRSTILKNLDVENHVLVGVDVQSSVSSLNEHGETDKASEKSIQNTLFKLGQQVQTTIKDLFKKQPAFPVNKPTPLKTSTLHILDGLVMAQVLSVRVQDRSQLCLNHCVLSSGYLGCYVRNANLTLVGNANWDSFVYIYGVRSVSDIEERSDEVDFIKELKAQWKQKLPNGFYLEGSPKAKTELSNINTSVIFVAPDDHDALSNTQNADPQKACLLCHPEWIRLVCPGSIFNVIPSSAAYFSFSEEDTTSSADRLADARKAARARVAGLPNGGGGLPSRGGGAYFSGGTQPKPLVLGSTSGKPKKNGGSGRKPIPVRMRGDVPGQPAPVDARRPLAEYTLTSQAASSTSQSQSMTKTNGRQDKAEASNQNNGCTKLSRPSDVNVSAYDLPRIPQKST